MLSPKIIKLMKLYIILLDTIRLIIITSLPLIKFIFKIIAMFTYLIFSYLIFIFYFCFFVFMRRHMFLEIFFLFKRHPEYLNFLIKLWLFIECSFFLIIFLFLIYHIVLFDNYPKFFYFLHFVLKLRIYLSFFFLYFLYFLLFVLYFF